MTHLHDASDGSTSLLLCKQPSWLVCISRLLLHPQSQQRKHRHAHMQAALNTHVTISKYPIAGDFSADTEGSRKSLLLYVAADCFLSGGSKCQEDFGKQARLPRGCRATAEGPQFRYVFQTGVFSFISSSKPSVHGSGNKFVRSK